MLKKIAKTAWKALPHAVIVMAGMLIVFFCIDRVNKPMGFMTNEFHKVLTFLLALISVGESVFIILYQRKRERFEEMKRRKARADSGRSRPAPPRAHPRPAAAKARPAADTARPQPPVRVRQGGKKA